MTRHEFEKRIVQTKPGSVEEQKVYDDLLADLKKKPPAPSVRK